MLRDNLENIIAKRANIDYIYILNNFHLRLKISDKFISMLLLIIIKLLVAS